MKVKIKTMISLAVSTAFTMFSVANADMNQAKILVDGLASHRISFNEGRSMWATLDAQTQKQARQYDNAQGTNYTGDYLYGAHAEYARGPATAQIAGQSMVPQLPATGIPAQPTHLDAGNNDTARRDAQLSAAIDHANSVKDGKDGINGANGVDGVTTTRIETDTATQDQVKANTSAIAKQDRTNDVQTSQIEVTNQRITGDELTQANRARTAEQHVQATSETETSIRGVHSEQAVQGEFIQREAVAIDQNSAAITSNAQRIDNNSQRIDRNAKRIDETREDLKKGLNNAAAMTGLHYHSNDAYAISAGTANGEGAALAGGLSHGFTPHTAATVQASTSMDGGYMASVGFSGDF